MNEEDTYWKLKIGHLLKRKDALLRNAKESNLDLDFKNFGDAAKINGELCDINSQLISIYQEELEKFEKEIDAEIERLK